MALAQVELDQKIEKQVKEPNKYRVIVFDDDGTPFDWVIAILMKVFNYSKPDAVNLSKQVDTEGMGVVGLYSYEIAEQKSSEAIVLSRSNGFDLDLKVEKA